MGFYVCSGDCSSELRLDTHLPHDVVRAVDGVHDPEDVARVDADRAGDLVLDHVIRADAFPVRIERQPGHFTPGIERRSEEHTSELQSQSNLVCRLLLEKKKIKKITKKQ